MSDTQPLLSNVRSSSNNAGQSRKTFQSIGKIVPWFRSFIGKHSDDNSGKFHSNDHGSKELPIGLFQLFRFADRTDYLLLTIGLFGSLLYGLNFIVYVILFGRMTGTFALQSFVDTCQQQLQNTSAYISSEGCPLGVELNSVNYHRMQKFCDSSRNIPTSVPSTLSMVMFRENVMKKVYLLLIVGTVAFFAIALQHYLFELSAKRQTSRIRLRLFQAIMQRSISYFDTKPTGQLNAKLFNNVDKLESGIGYRSSIMITVAISVIGSMFVALSINWKLTLIMLFNVPLVYGGTYMFFKVNTSETIKELNSYSKAGQIVQEVFSSLRTVLSLNGSKFEEKRYQKELESTQWSTVRKGAILGVLSGWLYFIKYLIYSSGFLFGFFVMYKKDDKSYVSDVLVIVIIFGQCIAKISFVTHFLQSYAEARATAAPVFRLIAETEGSDAIETEPWMNDIPMEEVIHTDGDVYFDNITFAYPARKNVSVLQNLTLVARAGETTALVGSSGCGKSTCISLLLRYYEPLSGEITINSQPIAEYNVQPFRRHIGVVSQEPFLFGTSIYENIRYGNINASSTDIEEAARQANAHDFIMRLPKKYETLVGERGVQLSGGEKQRVALARALVKKPSLLLLDEATSALDSANEKIVQEALDRACQGRTTIVIAHRLTTIRNAHRIYVMDKGCIIEEGTHQTLMEKQGKYYDLVQTQQMNSMEHEDDNMSNGEADKEDEKQFFERTHLSDIDEANDTDQKSASPANERYIFLRLLAMNSPEWPFLLIGCVACTAVGASQSLYALLLSKIVQAFGACTYDEERRQVIILSCIFLLLGLASLLIRFFQFGAFAISGAKLTKRVRTKAFAILLRQEIAYFDRPENSSGSICNRLSSNALALQQMTGTRLGSIVETVAMFGFGIILGFWFSFQLTLVASLFTIVIFVVAAIHIVSEARLKKRTGRLIERASSIAVETIHNMRTVKQLAIEKEFLRQYAELIHETSMIRRKHLRIATLRFSMAWSLGLYVLAALYAVALVLVENHQLDPRNIIIVLAFVIFVNQSMQIFLSLSNEIGASLSAARIFFKLFDRTPTIDNGSTEGKQLMDFRGEIEFNQVKFAYTSRPASRILDNFQLSIKPGQRVALVGTSGCGKSTAIQLLERFYDPSHGQLLLDGVDIRQLNIQWVRSRFGLVNQEPILFDLTIAENITYGLENVSFDDIIKAATKANIDHFIQQLPDGYETRVGQKGSRLSGGEKQRIAIARAILRRPKVLLLDEATSAMDSHNEQIVQQALEQVENDDPSRTSIIIAHRLSTIRSCDLICVLDKGRLTETGNHIALMQQRGIYYRMVMQNRS